MHTKKRAFFSLGLLAALLVLIPLNQALAQAAEASPEKLVQIRLLPERGTIKPNEVIWIGIEQSISPGWHTYWRNPGDSGIAPKIEWSLPEGFKIDDIQWPVPHKLPYGKLMNYGYEDSVILLQKLTALSKLPEGPLKLTADIEILVCKEECIPEYGTYELTLNGPESGAENNQAYLQAAFTKLPPENTLSGTFMENDGHLVLTFDNMAEGFLSEFETPAANLYLHDWGIVDNPSNAETLIEGDDLLIRQKRGERSLATLDSLGGVLIDDDGYSYGFTVAKTGTGEPGVSTVDPATVTDNFAYILLLALLGGVILNLMPCVFPVLSIKALSLVKFSDAERRKAQMSGLAYTAGVVSSFLVIAGALIALKAAGESIGWGFQLQNPLIVGLLSYLLFIIGLNMSGAFHIRGHFGNFGDKLTRSDGLTGAFFTGVLATLVATPCTAPFMAGAIGYALLQSAPVALLIFAALGFGLALPYLLLSFIPALQKLLPKPGAWMEVFRQFLAFPMFASAAWLAWVLGQQTGMIGVLGVLMGMVLVAFAFWLIEHQPQAKFSRIGLRILAALCLLLAFGFIPKHTAPVNPAAESEYTFGEVYSAERLETALASDYPVFVEMTAAWCITCKVNHTVAIDVPSTRALFEQSNMIYMVGDWTNQDAHITDYLKAFGRSGVPIYVYYGPPVNNVRPEPVVLPQILTPGIVADTIKG